mmetsp:Transcript_31579/g.42780  ORF Transcript_31579/g.42780 Transcript_31579/m.42780 type:complete len:260 (-) Transcript_31579:28-807(-)
MHFIVVPVTIVLTIIGPLVDTLSVEVVSKEFTLVGTTILPGELAFAFLLAHKVLTFISGLVRPGLLSLTVLLVFGPLSFVVGTISMLISTIAVLLVIIPFTSINITVAVNKTSLAVSFIFLPEAFIDRSILGNLLTFAITHVGLGVPLTIKNVTVVKSVLSCLSLNAISRLILISVRSELLKNSFNISSILPFSQILASLLASEASLDLGSSSMLLRLLRAMMFDWLVIDVVVSLQILVVAATVASTHIYKLLFYTISK